MTNTRRAAIIDCGTNTIRLLIADDDGRGGLTEVDRRMEIVRLGQGVDAKGEFHPDAMRRTFSAADRYSALIREYEVTPDLVRFVATSATRDARNREAFFAGIEQRLGVTPEVISGDDEARLSYAGAVSGVADAQAPVLVVDIGGGSTELIIGDADQTMQHAVSLDIGSVRLTERYLRSDPPDRQQLSAAVDHVDRLLDGEPIDWTSVRTWIGVAGTLTTLAAIDLDLSDYDRSLVHTHRIAAAEVIAIADRLAGSTVEQIRAFGSVHPQRADVITAGALIAARIAARLPSLELVVSESDILDGTAMELLHGPDQGSDQEREHR
ncbi:Ppx/GppA family phosphatase [Microlunatus elymi]|uniref:Ppx/GppA family phosphatase n=1 Tax=Microlunatus elymi TaxID=2596828 RepID=A0A516Q3C6_9ACTN|nr:Ppx/GppA phosphatase family protein [Microlunatus elymi]QDP97935.1 Ppx/GppA family phosphatase [Microlunatus elymi]